MAPDEHRWRGEGWRGEGWRCYCGATYPLGTPRCPPCAEALAQKVAELRSLRTGLPPHLTAFGPGAPIGRAPEPGDGGQPDPTDVPSRVSRLVALLQSGQVLTGESVSSLFGCSDRTGRRLLAEAHRALTPSRDEPGDT